MINSQIKINSEFSVRLFIYFSSLATPKGSIPQNQYESDTNQYPRGLQHNALSIELSKRRNKPKWKGRMCLLIKF